MIIKFILLLLLIPVSLFINFFVFKLAFWDYEIKIWIIYSIIEILSNIVIIIIVRKILIIISKFIFIEKFNMKEFINLTSFTFLMANIFLSLGIFQKFMWIYLPMFQTIFIFLFGMKFLNKKMVEKNKLTLFKQIFTIKRIKKNKELKKGYLLLLITILLYVSLSMLTQFIISKNYNPSRESLIYNMRNSGYKVKF